MRKLRDPAYDEFTRPDELKCACGCELQLSKGDLRDAMIVLARLGGRPRTWGVDISLKASDRVAERQEPPDPQVGRPCSKCGDMVYLPEYAAKMLDERKCFWPLCGDCQSKKKKPEPPANQYWE